MRRVETACFYHCYLGHGWGNAARDHVAALKAAGLSCPVTISLAGGEPERDWAMDWWSRQLPGAQFAGEASLAAGWRWACEHPGAAVLYAGEADDAALPALLRAGHYAQAWRRSVTAAVVGGWRDCLEHLASADVAGCHWLGGGFAGGCWWARAGYLASLPEPGPERWLGSPAVCDLSPGRPDPAAFTRDILEAMNPSLRSW